MATPPLFTKRRSKVPRRDTRPISPADDDEPIIVRKPTKAPAPRNNSRPHAIEDITTYIRPVEAIPTVPFVEGPPSTYPLSSHSSIPTGAAISAAKQQRARKAQEASAEEYIPLEDYDSDGEFKPQRMQVSSFVDKVEKDTRLIRDDEDIAEGFESFVDDPGRVTLSKSAKREQERKEKESLRAMIAEAEDSSDESDSSAERNNAYETAQTSRGMDGLSLKKTNHGPPRQPKEITPIPKLAAVLARFREGIQGLEFERGRLSKRQADIQKESLEIARREENIQRLLAETGEKFQQLRREAEEPVNDISNSPVRLEAPVV